MLALQSPPEYFCLKVEADTHHMNKSHRYDVSFRNRTWKCVIVFMRGEQCSDDWSCRTCFLGGHRCQHCKACWDYGQIRSDIAMKIRYGCLNTSVWYYGHHGIMYWMCPFLKGYPCSRRSCKKSSANRGVLSSRHGMVQPGNRALWDVIRWRPSTVHWATHRGPCELGTSQVSKMQYTEYYIVICHVYNL